MRIRRLLLTLLVALVGSSALSPRVQASDDYTVMVIASGASRSIVEDLWLPAALERDCDRSPALVGLCDTAYALEGGSFVEAVVTLHAEGAILELAFETDASGRRMLASDDCELAESQRSPSFGAALHEYVLEPNSDAARTVSPRRLARLVDYEPASDHRGEGGDFDGGDVFTWQRTAAAASASRSIHTNDRAILDPPASCVDRAQEELDLWDAGEADHLPLLDEIADRAPARSNEDSYWVYVYRVMW